MIHLDHLEVICQQKQLMYTALRGVLPFSNYKLVLVTWLDCWTTKSCQKLLTLRSIDVLTLWRSAGWTNSRAPLAKISQRTVLSLTWVHVRWKSKSKYTIGIMFILISVVSTFFCLHSAFFHIYKLLFESFAELITQAQTLTLMGFQWLRPTVQYMYCSICLTSLKVNLSQLIQDYYMETLNLPLHEIMP